MMRAPLRLLIVTLIVALLAVLAIPLLLHRAEDRAQRQRTIAGIALIHRFDCTYGHSLRELLSSAAYSTSLQSAASFQLAKQQHGKERRLTLVLARGQQARAADLLRQFGAAQPLTTPAQLRLLPPEDRSCFSARSSG